jgi:hypothetical protein
MEKTNTRGGGRTLRSALGKILSVGACSALLVTGVVLATATAASAAGVATQVKFTVQPTSPTTAGSPLASFAVSIEDGSSAVETTGASSTDTVAITSSCTLAGTLSVAAVAGVATFTAVAINTGTSCTLLATDTTENLTTDTSSAVSVNPTTLAKVGFTTQPTTPAISGNNMATFRVATEDTYGNVITSGVAATDTITITSACTLGGTLSAPAVAGVATFSAAIIDGGTSPCTLTATDSSRALTTAVSSGVTVTAGTATKVAFTTQPPATVVASAVLTTFKVSVEDATAT